MVWLTIWELAFLYLACFDAQFTIRRLKQEGVEAELNPWIKKLCYWKSIAFGVTIGIMVPTMVIAVVGAYFPHFLTFSLGVRYCLFLLQKRSDAE